MKGLGICLLAVSLTVFGWVKSAALSRRVRLLQAVQTLCERMEQQLRFSPASPSEILTRVSADSVLRSLSFLKAFAAISPEMFHARWKREITLFCRKNGFSEEERTLLLDFGAALGTTDLYGQQRLCTAMAARFTQLYTAARAEAAEKGRLYASLGGIGGAAVALILI